MSMLEQRCYVDEKLRELDRREPLRLPDPGAGGEPPRRTRPIVGGLARVAGRSARRLGEALESWSAAPAR
jgi:hypothetical protein